jgi:hypothetical protein
MYRRIMYGALALCMLAGAGHAQQIDVVNSRWGIDPVPCLLQVSNCPLGDGEQVALGCGAGAAEIWVRLIDTFGNPVVGLPPTDIWFRPCNASETLCWCRGQDKMDFPTDASGWTHSTIALYCGGCAVLDGIQCVVFDPWLGAPVVLQSPFCIQDARFKSPDMNADCLVNISDLALFGACYAMPMTPPCHCADYNDDGLVNLSDLAYFGSHYQHECP